MDIRSERFWLHPLTMGAVIAGALLFVVLGGNAELLWIVGAVAIGAAVGWDRSRVRVRSECVCGNPDDVAVTRAERAELAPTVGHLPRRATRTREREA